ncbi:MAG: SGNH/GDSL hydrolase family protein [Blastocatellales bacterium]
MKSWIIKITFGLVVLAGLVVARSPQDCASTIAALEQRVEAQRRLLADWAGLIHYGSENAELPKPKPFENRVVFLGDEITERWGQGKAKFFPGKPYLNRGIAGQTTPQMLVRFRQDVIALKPKVVVILAGMNDIASFYEPITGAMTAENITSTVELAKANNIKVVLCSLTPINDVYGKQSLLRPFGKIIGINNWLENYAASSGSIYLNYYSAMGEGRNLKKELSDDGLLPNDAGYAVMAPLAEAAIAQALSKQ